MTKDELLALYKRGYKKINEQCKFQVVRYFEDKVVSYKGKEFNVPIGSYVLDVDDVTLGAWLWLNSELKKMGATYQDFVKIIAECEGE